MWHSAVDVVHVCSIVLISYLAIILCHLLSILSTAKNIVLAGVKVTH